MGDILTDNLGIILLLIFLGVVFYISNKQFDIIGHLKGLGGWIKRRF